MKKKLTGVDKLDLCKPYDVVEPSKFKRLGSLSLSGAVNLNSKFYELRTGQRLIPGHIYTRELNVLFPDMPIDYEILDKEAYDEMPLVNFLEYVKKEYDENNASLSINHEIEAGFDTDKTLDRRNKLSNLHEITAGNLSIAKCINGIFDNLILKNDDMSAKPTYSGNIIVMERYIVEFLELNPDAVLDIHRTGSVRGINDFIKYYKSKSIYEEYITKGYFEILNNSRSLLVDTLRTRKMKKIFGGKENAERLASIFENQHVLVEDPLSALLSIDHVDDEVYGTFDPYKNKCLINPAAIHGSIYDRDGIQAKLEFKLMQTLAHELMHASNGYVYRYVKNGHAKNDEDFKGIELRPKSIWPKFIVEAMVEKASYMLALEAFSKKLLKKNIKKYEPFEDIYRRFCSDEPREVLTSASDIKARKFVEPTYLEYRLLLDTLMDKADWERAGTSRDRAERLLIDAFFISDSNSPNMDNSYRKKFMSSLNKATHPGFLNKLGMLVDEYGASSMLDVLESPNFNINNPALLPIMANRIVENALKVKATRFPIFRSLLENAIQIQTETGIDHGLVVPREKDLRESEFYFNHLKELELAKNALKSFFIANFGNRDRGNYRHMVNMQIGLAEAKKMPYIFDNTQEVEDHLLVMQKWKSSLEENKNKWLNISSV